MPDSYEHPNPVFLITNVLITSIDRADRNAFAAGLRRFGEERNGILLVGFSSLIAAVAINL